MLITFVSLYITARSVIIQSIKGVPLHHSQWVAKETSNLAYFAGSETRGPIYRGNGKLVLQKWGAQFAGSGMRGPICKAPICRGNGKLVLKKWETATLAPKVRGPICQVWGEGPDLPPNHHGYMNDTTLWSWDDTKMRCCHIGIWVLLSNSELEAPLQIWNRQAGMMWIQFLRDLLMVVFLLFLLVWSENSDISELKKWIYLHKLSRLSPPLQAHINVRQW